MQIKTIVMLLARRRFRLSVGIGFDCRICQQDYITVPGDLQHTRTHGIKNFLPPKPDGHRAAGQRDNHGGVMSPYAERTGCPGCAERVDFIRKYPSGGRNNLAMILRLMHL